MKQKYLSIIFTCIITIASSFAQLSAGDIAFVAFNADGDDDFAIVALVDIDASTTIYFTDSNWDGVSAFAASEGTIAWDSGLATIKAGSIIIFTDVDSDGNTNYGVNIGSITTPDSGFNLSGSGDTLLAYRGSLGAPDAFLTGIRNAELEAGELDNTGLTSETNFMKFSPTASPDGGYYSGSKSNQTSYSNYLSFLVADDEDVNYSWTHDTSNGENILPISEETFTINTTNWTGGSSSVWNLAGNWSNGIPTTSSLVTIPDVTTSPIISSGTEAQVGNLTIDASEILTINAANSLTINGTLTVTGDLVNNSGSSIMVNGTATGNLTYKRTLTTNWHLLSSPVGSQDINTFTVTDVATNAIATSGTNYGVAPYDNNGTAWSYFTTGTIAGAGNFTEGKGYSALRTSSGDVTFTGTFPTSDVSIAITDGTSNEWNLIGNPYPSYIPANSGADATNNFITINTADLNASYQAVYFWDGSSYTPINHASGSRFIAPGQGFFVNSIASGATVDFTEEMQSHQSTDVFSKTTASWTAITFKMTDGSSNKTTDIKYIPGTTAGLDLGYDAGMFTGVSNSFSIYTHLVANSNGTNFALQALPDSEFETTTIPIGFNAISGKEITFSINHQNLPSGLMVFLEDKVARKIVRIDEVNSNYKIILNSDNSGIGRFYLRTSTTDLTKTLNTNTFNLNNVRIYLSSKRNLQITGVDSEYTNIKLYNILGKRILNRNMPTDTVLNLTLPTSIKKGIYIVKLETEKGNINKKILIK